MYICNIKLRFESLPRNLLIPDDVLEDLSLDFCHALNEILHEEDLIFRGCSIGFQKKEKDNG